MKFLFIGASFWLAAAVPGFCQVEDSLNWRAEAPAYERGDYWVFKVTRWSLKQNSADEIQQGGEFILYPEDNRTRVFRLVEGKRFALARPRPLPDMLPTARVRQSQAKLYDFPLYVGKEWTAPGFQNKLTSPINKVIAIENVTTAAGRFQTFKIERVIGRTMRSGNARRFWFTYYYSPETGSLVKYQYEHNTLLDGPEETLEIELVRYGTDEKGNRRARESAHALSTPKD